MQLTAAASVEQEYEVAVPAPRGGGSSSRRRAAAK